MELAGRSAAVLKVTPCSTGHMGVGSVRVELLVHDAAEALDMCETWMSPGSADDSTAVMGEAHRVRSLEQQKYQSHWRGCRMKQRIGQTKWDGHGCLVEPPDHRRHLSS